MAGERKGQFFGLSWATSFYHLCYMLDAAVMYMYQYPTAAVSTSVFRNVYNVHVIYLLNFVLLTELPEFLIYVAGTHVHRVMMGSNRDEIIYTNTVNNIVAAEFDLSSNCMFVGMASEIQVDVAFILLISFKFE